MKKGGVIDDLTLYNKKQCSKQLHKKKLFTINLTRHCIQIYIIFDNEETESRLVCRI